MIELPDMHAIAVVIVVAVLAWIGTRSLRVRRRARRLAVSMPIEAHLGDCVPPESLS